MNSLSRTMSPFTSKVQICPAGMTNGGVLVGSHPPRSDAAAGTAVTATMAAASSSVFTTRM